MNPRIAALAVAGVSGPACAQVGCPYPPTPECQTLQRNDEDRRRTLAEEEARRRNEQDNASSRGAPAAPSWQGGQAGQYAENDVAQQALRARLLAAPALPADRNPLLGRWRVASNAKAGGGDDLAKLMGMLSNPGGTICEVVFGGGITEFLPDSWSSLDSAGNDSLGPIQYRKQGDKVFAIPVQGLPLLGFNVIDGNNIQEFRVENCNLARVSAKSAAVPARATLAARPATVGVAATPIASSRPASKPIDPDSPLGRGVRLHGEKEFQPALQQLLVAAQSTPDDPRVYVYLADTYGWLGMADEASEAAKRAKKLDPAAFDILR
jgi:tetratricopeptide (TPR) repeat protein